MDPARGEAVDKHAASIAVAVDEVVLRGTVPAAAGKAAPAPAIVAAPAPDIDSEEEDEVLVFDSMLDLHNHVMARRNREKPFAAAPKLQPVAVVPEGSSVLPGIDGEGAETEADPLPNLTEEKVTATAAVAPLQLPVVEVAEGSCVLPCKDGEDAALDADLRQTVTATAAVTPLQVPVDEVPDDSCLLPGHAGEDTMQKQVADVESPPPDVASSNKRKYGAGGELLSYEDEEYNSSNEYEYDSEDSVDEENAKSFGRRIHKKLDDGVLVIGGVFRNKKEWFTCPFCPGTPKDGNWHALTVHAESLSLYGPNKKVRVQHDVLSHFMCGVNRPNIVPRSDRKKKKKWF